ncbi:hypothetical protein EV363DRAFT_1177388 [Boletus edulis]|nr:hypothetical protein EV363DRAFT_1177388 [Boletus edulis]
MVLLVLFAHNLTLAPIYTKAISILPTLVGFVAKSVPHISKGERHKGYRICDIAFEHFHSSHLRFLLLTKAIIVFMAGERPDAISRLLLSLPIHCALRFRHVHDILLPRGEYRD